MWRRRKVGSGPGRISSSMKSWRMTGTTDSVRSAPSGGLVLRYDFKKFLFHGDAAAVSAARRDLSLQKARLAIESAVRRFEDLVIEWRQLQEVLPLEDQRVAEFHRLMEAVHSLDELGRPSRRQLCRMEAPRTSGAARTKRGVSSEEKRARVAPDGVRAGGRVLNRTLGSLDFLLQVPPLPERPAGEGEVRRWLPGVWQSHPACRIAEDDLFQAEMAVIGAKRERLPRLTGSVGLGNIDTWVGTQIVEANAVAEIGISTTPPRTTPPKSPATGFPQESSLLERSKASPPPLPSSPSASGSCAAGL